MGSGQGAQTWYRDGLRFECTQCGDCCTGDPGYVWVDAEEIERLAAAVGESTEDFEAKYVKRVGRNKSLAERPNGECVLFERGLGCTVYADRPRQCRTWPFWESNVQSPDAWKEVCRECPGAGQGRLHTAEEILEQSRVIRL